MRSVEKLFLMILFIVCVNGHASAQDLFEKAELVFNSASKIKMSDLGIRGTDEVRVVMQCVAAHDRNTVLQDQITVLAPDINPIAGDGVIVYHGETGGITTYHMHDDSLGDVVARGANNRHEVWRKFTKDNEQYLIFQWFDNQRSIALCWSKFPYVFESL